MKKAIKLIFVFFNCICCIDMNAQCCIGSISGTELVVNGDFSKGNIGFTTYYEYAPTPGLGRYGITDDANSVHPVFWSHCKGHSTGTDSFLWVDLSGSSSVNIWTQKLSQISHNSYYMFSCWVNNLGDEGPGTLQFSINGKLMGFPLKASETLCYWKKFCFLWYSGNTTFATITITNQSSGGSGNDCGIDDISFRKYEPVTYYKPIINICEGESFMFPNGKKAFATVTYYDTFKKIGGCDSILATRLIVHQNYDLKYSISLCAGETYTLPDGKIVNTTGDHFHQFKTHFGCDSFITTKIVAHEKLLHSSSYRNVTCFGYSDGSISLKSLNGAAPFVYEIKGVGKNNTGEFLNLKNGEYSYLIKDANGCMADGLIAIEQPDEIKMSVYQSDFTIDVGSQVRFQLNTNYKNAKWKWSPNLYLNCDTCSDVVSLPDSSIIYSILATVPIENNWCKNDTSVMVRIKPYIYLPNAFTPNKDLLNDMFCISATNVESIETLKIQVLNAWGQIVFESNEVGFLWDGTFKNKSVPQGVYVYALQYKLKNKRDSYNQRGTLTILK